MGDQSSPVFTARKQKSKETPETLGYVACSHSYILTCGSHSGDLM